MSRPKGGQAAPPMGIDTQEEGSEKPNINVSPKGNPAMILTA